MRCASVTTRGFPLGDGKEWRFAATSDVLKLRLSLTAVKLKRAFDRWRPGQLL